MFSDKMWGNEITTVTTRLREKRLQTLLKLDDIVVFTPLALRVKAERR